MFGLSGERFALNDSITNKKRGKLSPSSNFIITISANYFLSVAAGVAGLLIACVISRLIALFSIFK